EEDIGEAEVDRLVHQPAHIRQTNRAARSVRARLGDAVRAAQVAVVVSVDPQLPLQRRRRAGSFSIRTHRNRSDALYSVQLSPSVPQRQPTPGIAAFYRWSRAVGYDRETTMARIHAYGSSITRFCLIADTSLGV